MGSIFMLASTILVFFLAQKKLGTFLGIVSSILFLLCWMAINIRAAKSGLIRANLTSYFRARSRGMNHEEALITMVNSRYPLSESKRLQILGELSREGDEKDELFNILFAMHCLESGRVPPASWATGFFKEINRIYASMLKKEQN